MGHPLAGLACLLIPLSLPTATQETNEEKIQVIKRILSATVKVTASFGDGTAASGTGVAVVKVSSGDVGGDYKLIITNSHVVSTPNKATKIWEVAPKIRVKVSPKAGKGELEAYLLYHELKEDAFRDIAYLIVRDPNNILGTAELPARRDIATGTPVYACGNPLGLEFLPTLGKLVDISSVPLDKDEEARAKTEQVLFHDSLTERGNSGGGLFNAKGELIGINTWLYNGRVGMAQDIFKFFENHRLGFVHIRASYGRPQMLWSEYLTKGQGVRALAFGEYTCAKDGRPMSAAGVAGNKDGCVNPAFNFGALLFTIAGTTKSFDFAYPGSDGAPVRYDNAVLCDELTDIGRFTFTLNDKQVLDNAGDVSVVYLITGPAVSDVGLQVTEPTDAERQALKLTRSYTENGKTTTYSCGAKVTAVTPGSEAAAAGLQAGDIVLSCPGPTTTNDILGMITRDLVDSRTLGEHLRWARGEFVYKLHGVALEVMRDGKRIELKLRFGDFK